MKAFVQKHKILLTLLPVLAVMIMIFCFSGENAQESNSSSGVVVNWIYVLFYPDFDKLAPSEQVRIAGIVSYLVRKSAHLVEFALLGFALFAHVCALSSRVKIQRPRLLSFGIGALYAVSDELHQTFISGRSGQLSDVMLDSVGVLIGIMLLWCLLRRRKKRKS